MQKKAGPNAFAYSLFQQLEHLEAICWWIKIKIMEDTLLFFSEPSIIKDVPYIQGHS